MSVCGGWSLVSNSGFVRRAITLWCRSWSCPDCAPYRAAQLKKMALRGQPRTFLTLTVNPAEGQSPEDRARQLSDALKLLIKRARRKFTKGPIDYLAVFEETKKGEPHLHLLMRAPYIPQKWLSDQMAELINAPIVDIRTVGNQKKAAWYVSKYVAKGTKAFGTLKRYWATPKYDLERTTKADTEDMPWPKWHVWKDSLYTLAEQMAHLGFAVTWISENEWRHFAGDRLKPP